MVKQSTRTFLTIVLIIFIAFNILSMIEGKKHSIRHNNQIRNRHEFHQRCPNSKHHTGTNRKKRSHLSTMNPTLLNKNVTFDIFYDNSKFEKRDIPFSRYISHKKPWNSKNKRENYLENLEKIFGHFPQDKNLGRIKRSSESGKKFNQNFLKNENIQQILNNLEEKEFQNHIRIKRDNSEFNEISSPSKSSEYLQNLAESFARQSESEETQDIDTQEMKNDRKKIQNLKEIKKRNTHHILLTNRNKNRLKRDRDPDELKIQNYKKSYNKKINNLKHEKMTGKLRMGLTKRYAKSLNEKLIKKKPIARKKGKPTKERNIPAKKNKSSRMEKKFPRAKNTKRSLEMMKNSQKTKNGIDRLRNKREHSIRESSDLYESLKSSSSLEEIKNLAENLISKIDHLEESIKKQRIK